jgi:flagellar assembly factor FliW
MGKKGLKFRWHACCYALVSMNTMELDQLETLYVPHENLVHLAGGLLGFEHLQNFMLITQPGEEPFSWLQVMDDPDLAFVVIPPFLAVPEYLPDISPEDAEAIGIEHPEDATIYNIVTLRPGGRATVNLKGPVVLNRYTMRGKQVVISNAADYSVRHPLPVSK